MPNELGFDDKIIAYRQGRWSSTTSMSFRVRFSLEYTPYTSSTSGRARGLASVDRKPAFWKYGEMKTTLDLPDDLMREVKIRAVHEHKKLKDAIAELIRKGMAAGKTRAPKLPKPLKLRGGFKPTTEDIEAAIAWGRD
jgi:plasmid stability protein